MLQHRPVVTLKNSKALPKYIFLSFKNFPNTSLIAILKALWLEPAVQIHKTPANQPAPKCIVHTLRNVTEQYLSGSSYCQRTQTRSSSRCINGPRFWIRPWFWKSHFYSAYEKGKAAQHQWFHGIEETTILLYSCLRSSTDITCSCLLLWIFSEVVNNFIY